MNYEDERTRLQFNKHGFIKVIIFLALIIAIITYRIIVGINIIRIIFLLTIPVVSVTLLVKGIKKKRLTFSDVTSGIHVGDERIINITDASGMKAIGFGTGILFAYIVAGEVIFSSNNIVLELLLFLLVCSDIAIEGRFINKNYIAVTDYGFEQPYYEDNKKKKEIIKRMLKTWFMFAIFFTVADLIANINILKQSPAKLLSKYISLLPGELIICLIFAIIDILIMKFINKKIYKQIK